MTEEKTFCFLSCVFDRRPPVPWMRVSSNGRQRYTPPKYAIFKKELANFLKERFAHLRPDKPENANNNKYYFREFLRDHRYMLICRFYTKNQAADGDNYLKGVQDALQTAGVIYNDAQISAALSVKVLETEYERTEIEMYRMPPVGNESNLPNLLGRSMVETLQAWYEVHE